MRFQEIHKACREAHDIFPEIPDFFELDDASEVKKMVPLVRRALSCLSGSNLFEVERSTLEEIAVKIEVEYIPTLPLYAVSKASPNFKMSADLVKKFLDEAIRIKTKLETIVRLFEVVNYKTEADGFDIKLPSNMSLSELSKCTKDLDTIFSTCPIFKDKGTITFSAVDVGSVWLSFAIGSVAAVAILKAIAELVDKALIIRSHYLTTREQEENIKRLNLGNEILNTVAETNKTVGNALMKKTCDELAEKHNINDPEDRERIRHSLNLMTDWMSKGMEIYPSVIAPPETKAVFPPVERQALPKSVSALLDDGKTDEE